MSGGDRPRDREVDFLTDLFENPLDPGYADAARRRAARPPAPGWRRRGAAGLRLVTLVLTGLLLAVAYHAAMAAQPQAGRARADLVADLKARRAQADDLQRRADQLREQVLRQRDEALGGTDGEADRLRLLEAATGLGKVVGDGVVVKLADAPAPVDPVTGRPAGTNLGVVLDRDLQDIANELWRDGAEAIAINGQRLTATSTIRAAGSAILVDFRPITPPYQVSAIGPDELQHRFTESSTGRRFRRYADAYGMQFSIRAQAGLSLPAASEPRLRFAHPPGSPSPSGSAPSTTGTPTPVPSPTGGGR